VPLVTLEEYLCTSYEPETEYVEGVLVDRHVGEYWHSLTQTHVIEELYRRERGYRTFCALRIQTAPGRIRVPDVCLKALPYEVKPVLTRPDLAVEILCPEDHAIDMIAKVGEYLASGIPHVWLVDPYRRKVVAANSEGLREARDLVLEAPLVGAIDFRPLFVGLDEPTE
jgi:Uma2 family endonuclease